MKKSILIIASILISNFGFSQIVPTDVSQPIESIDMKIGTDRPITWNTVSERSNLNGHRITNTFNRDSYQAFLNFQARISGSTFFNAMVINSKGYVGIGSDNPDALLTVKGIIHAEEIKVDLSVPADYVFESYYTGKSKLKSDYTMPTLAEIEVFTKKYHHLPEVPSAKDIQDNGLKLKEMTNILLQKIEELTIYTIEQEKRIKALEAMHNSKL